MQNARPSAVQVAAVPVIFYLFDLIWFDGYDLSALPLLARKSVLHRAIVFDDPIRFSEHLDEEERSRSAPLARRVGRASSRRRPRLPTRTGARTTG